MIGQVYGIRKERGAWQGGHASACLLNAGKGGCRTALPAALRRACTQAHALPHACTHARAHACTRLAFSPHALACTALFLTHPHTGCALPTAPTPVLAGSSHPAGTAEGPVCMTGVK